MKRLIFITMVVLTLTACRSGSDDSNWFSEPDTREFAGDFATSSADDYDASSMPSHTFDEIAVKRPRVLDETFRAFSVRSIEPNYMGEITVEGRSYFEGSGESIEASYALFVANTRGTVLNVTFSMDGFYTINSRAGSRRGSDVEYPVQASELMQPWQPIRSGHEITVRLQDLTMTSIHYSSTESAYSEWFVDFPAVVITEHEAIRFATHGTLPDALHGLEVSGLEELFRVPAADMPPEQPEPQPEEPVDTQAFAEAEPTEGDGEITEPDIPAPERDLGGLVINIANWWSDEATDNVMENSFTERARWNDRRAMEERHNFRINMVRYGSWHDARDGLQREILAMNRDYQMWIAEPSWFAANQSQGLFAPIPLHHFEGGIEWSRAAIEATTRDGMAYGFMDGVEMTGGVYFNMRLLEESGIDRYAPFTLQAANNWTWETFTDLARRSSRDTNGDGIPDIWAITSFHHDFLDAALASNGAAYAEFDGRSRFVNTSNTDAFREALEWTVSLRDEWLAMHEDDVLGEWDAFIEMFDSGRGVFRAAQNYVANNIQLQDNWGFVAFPRGPRMDTHMGWVYQNLYVIPHFYTPEEVDDFMYAYRLWVRPIDTVDPNDWMFDMLAQHPERRSVNETMANYTRNPYLQSMPAHQMMSVPITTLGENFAWRIWIGNDAGTIIAEAQQPWEAFIERINANNAGR